MPKSKHPHLVLLPSPRDAAPRVVLKNTLGSLVRALSELPEWVGVLATSELDQRIVFRKAPPFSRDGLVGAPVRDRDMDRIRHWFEENHGLVASKAHVVDAVRIVADGNGFHRVREYLDGLVWDGTPRVDRWLERFCGVVARDEAQSSLLRSVSRRWLVSGVARAMQPGCKVDTMLILEGAQGIGKSSALAALAGDGFFCDSAIDFGSKDACQQIQGVWIYEVPEVDGLFRAETSAIKGFLSRSEDRFRVPYGRAPETVPRSVVFCGTVNHQSYLRDRTGNRRFWVVRCEGPLDVAGIRAVRDDLWAEARHLYMQGEPWYLAGEDEAVMRDEQDARLETDPWEETIEGWLAARGDPPFTMNEILEGALGLRAHCRNPHVTRRVSQLLERHGFERRKPPARPRTYQFAKRGAAV